MSKSMAKATRTAGADESAKPMQEVQTVKEDAARNPKGQAEYSVEELIASSEAALHVPRECAAAALKPQKAKRMTLAEAADNVDKFMKKEVK